MRLLLPYMNCTFDKKVRMATGQLRLPQLPGLVQIAGAITGVVATLTCNAPVLVGVAVIRVLRSL